MPTNAKPIPYIPRPWQLPHLLGTPIGGTVLLVERAKHEPHVSNRGSSRGVEDCPLGPVGTVLSIEGVGDLRTTAIDLRRTDAITESEAGMAGCRGWYAPCHPDLGSTDGRTPEEEFRDNWLADNPGAKWGEWAWFVTAERIERTDQC